jgi:N-[(2S)-2-amino-2-carboxyethyl]-L-glutamate dehydrogenase
MHSRELIAITGEQVATCLAGRERELIDVVRRAYECHARGQAVLPDNVYVRFPNDPANRIIAKAGYLAEPFHVAGMKWVASFPANLSAGLDRASAMIVLNSPDTGRPQALLEGSIINARRTAASAALAAVTLARVPMPTATFVGCGPIAFETLRHLLVAGIGLTRVLLCDLDRQRAEAFAARARRGFAGLEIATARTLDEAAPESPLICFATSAQQPFVSTPRIFAPASVLLHISLRDVTPEVVLACDNVVDDVDHVCSANTALDVTARQTGSRAFIRCTIGQILTGHAPAHGTRPLTLFSPFGLAALDLAVAQWVVRLAVERELCHRVPEFISEPWAVEPGSVQDGVSHVSQRFVGAGQSPPFAPADAEPHSHG